MKFTKAIFFQYNIYELGSNFNSLVKYKFMIFFVTYFRRLFQKISEKSDYFFIFFIFMKKTRISRHSQLGTLRLVAEAYISKSNIKTSLKKLKF